MPEDVTKDLFCICAAWAYLLAQAEGRETDSEYVKRLAYGFYEREIREKNNR